MPHVHWRAGQAGREGGSAGSPWNILEPDFRVVGSQGQWYLGFHSGLITFYRCSF